MEDLLYNGSDSFPELAAHFEKHGLVLPEFNPASFEDVKKLVLQTSNEDLEGLGYQSLMKLDDTFENALGINSINRNQSLKELGCAIVISCFINEPWFQNFFDTYFHFFKNLPAPSTSLEEQMLLLCMFYLLK